MNEQRGGVRRGDPQPAFVSPEASSYMRDVGLFEPTPAQLAQIGMDYKQALLDGRAGRSALDMTPSLISPGQSGMLREGQRALVVEVGGTNIRVASVGIGAGEEPIIDEDEIIIAPHPMKEYRNVNEFYANVVRQAQPFLRLPYEAMGIIWSFPGRARSVSYGVDLENPELSKEIDIPGIADEPVGLALWRRLRPLDGETPIIPVVVTNDTVATAAVRADTAAGGIVASGFNFAFHATGPRQYINSESGKFMDVPIDQLTQQKDSSTKEPGKRFAEKIVAGQYIGPLMHLAASGLAQKGIVPSLQGELNDLSISHLLNGNRSEIQQAFSGPLSDQSFAALQAVAMRLRNRSAKIAGTMLRAGLEVFSSDSTRRLIVPIEGSMFWGMPGYGGVFQEYAGRNVEILEVSQAGMKGVAAAALRTRLS